MLLAFLLEGQGKESLRDVRVAIDADSAGSADARMQPGAAAVGFCEDRDLICYVEPAGPV